QYQMWHGLALLGIGLMTVRVPGKALPIAGMLFQAGIVLFSGTLYSFGALSMVPFEGAAPVGGGLLIIGWLILAIAGARNLKST
ncbi:MAG: DUF423 domain-containing protein, partial [Magnetovibrio sp.]|nr:DUF423 domain-containing protein [Magnetovibrio sp.]